MGKLVLRLNVSVVGSVIAKDQAGEIVPWAESSTVMVG
jgi:hypothetical protein